MQRTACLTPVELWLVKAELHTPVHTAAVPLGRPASVFSMNCSPARAAAVMLALALLAAHPPAFITDSPAAETAAEPPTFDNSSLHVRRSATHSNNLKLPFSIALHEAWKSQARALV